MEKFKTVEHGRNHFRFQNGRALKEEWPDNTPDIITGIRLQVLELRGWRLYFDCLKFCLSGTVSIEGVLKCSHEVRQVQLQIFA